MAVATLLHTASLFFGTVSLIVPVNALHEPEAIRATMMSAQVRVYDSVGLPAADRHRALEAAAQLLGTGGIAALLLAAGGGLPAAADVALTLALLAAFASMAFAKSGVSPEADDESKPGEKE